MTMPATLTVVLPNYNHAKFLSRALEALLAQERAPDEIIVIDDGSTDDSVRIIDQFAAKSPSIKVLLNADNRGVAPTLERGLQAASGEYIYFAAADDYVLPGFFELALRRLQANPQAGLFCGEAILVDGKTNRPATVRPIVRPIMHAGYLGPAQVESLLRSTDNWILTGSAVFRRECVLWAGGFNERLGAFADGYIARKIALKFGFFFEPKAVATWVVFADSVSRQTARELQRAKDFLEIVPPMIAADPGFPEWYASVFRDRWQFATCRLALQADPIDREFVLTMGARSAADRAGLQMILSLPGRKLVNLAGLVFLWYRLQPTSPVALLRTMLAMRFIRLALGF
jgi:glycosyltransferase involved in cell wall biosynthesis